MAKYNSVTTDEIEQTKKYKEALDELQKSVVGLNSKMPSFADGIKAGLQGIGEKLPEVVQSMIELNKQNKELEASGGKPISIFKQLASSMFSWNTLISVGVTLLASYSGALINWVGDLFKGETRLTAFGKAMKEQAILTDAVIQARLRGAQSAQGELTALETLYRATKNTNLSYEEQKKAREALRQQWPGTFKNLDDEAFKTGKAAEAYKNLKERILDTAYAEAYKNQITKNASRDIENGLRIAQEREKNLKIVAAEKKAQDALNEYSKSGVSIPSDRFITQLQNAVDRQTKLRDESDNKIYNIYTDKNRLSKQNNKFLDEIDKLTAKKGNGVSILTGVTQTDIEKPLKINKGNPPTNPKPKAPKPDTSPSENLIAAQSITIAQHFENEKKAYDNELALLNDQLSKKLISQAAYNKQSQALQEQYHQGIGSSVEKFALEDMAKTQKHLKDVAEAEGKFAYDETNVKKAILPGQKLDAEKQLITDKYNYEIVLANGNAEKIKELEIKKQEALTSVTQQYEQQRKDFALNTAQQVADKAFSIIGNNIKTSSDAKIKGLEKDKAGELSNKNLTATQRKAIEDKYQKKEAQEKTKAFKAEQRMSVLQAVVNGALAITKATAQTGVLAPFVIPGIIASTALQIATIVAQKPPAFAKGGRFVSDGRGALLPGYSRTDNTNAYLRSGEAVVVSEAMRNPWARNLVSAINVAHGGRDFSMPNTGRGYAIGGIFTDGGNANRYYNQPVNDAKELANTLAYQMINNFPPIYVDVKDVNNQQNILAQTVNRVNL
ncbi:MAG: hypothetical protein V4456_02870 [Bacteroidota bacterium]